MSECMAERRLHAKIQRKVGCRIAVAVHRVTRSWFALSKFIRLGSFQTLYSSHILYKRRKADLQVLK